MAGLIPMIAGPQVEISCYLKKFPDTRPAGVLNRAEAAVSRIMLFAPVKG
jgi:hypothetical protein